MKKYTVFFICLACSVIMVAGCSSHKKKVENKSRAEALRNLGEAYMSDGNYTKALRELLAAEQIYPNDPFLYNDLGLTYMAKGEPEKAVAHFKRALELEPDYAPAENNLGTAYIALEQWEKAIECFRSVKDDLLYATPYFPLTNLGYIHYKKGQYESAEKYYREALELKPDFVRALHGLGNVYISSGNYERAIEKLEEAVELVPTSPRLFMDLGRAYEKNHEYNRALNLYKKAEAVGRGTPIAEDARAAVDRLYSTW